MTTAEPAERAGVADFIAGQVAFRRRRGSAWLWLRGAARWVHHLEIQAVSDVDDEVRGWLREAADRAGGGRS